MENLVSLIASFLGLLFIALLARLVMASRREISFLRKRMQELSAQLAEQGQELDGICAAGVHLDRNLAEQHQKLRECLERLDSIQAEGAANSPYHGAIEMIRKGAAPQDVAQEFGMSLSEAELLVRLHRPV